MKRADQILQFLTNNTEPALARDIAAACDTTPSNLGFALPPLIESGLVEKLVTDKGMAYQATDAGRTKASSPEFGGDGRKSAPPTAKSAASPSPLAIGVFTTGELHIEANGKRMVLSKSQANELLEFVCSLPNRLFAPGEGKPARSAIASMVHQLSDEEPRRA